VVSGQEVLADRYAERDQAAGLDLVRIRAEVPIASRSSAMRRLSTRRRRSATASSRWAQLRIARSIGNRRSYTLPYGAPSLVLYGIVYMNGNSVISVDPVASAVGMHNLPESVRALSSLRDIDYADQFTLATDADATPEQWARAMFGDVPSVTELLIWRGLLGLRLGRGRSPATVAGWRIGGRGEDWIRLEAASWFITGVLLVQTADGRVSLGTFLRYERRIGRGVWPPLSAIHRRLAPGLLHGAAARIQAPR
jgi:hypothetical protein